MLLFAIYQLPYWTVSYEHDSGAQAAIEFWTLHHYQYGTQIVQNVGPFGFINYPKLYSGFLDREKFVLNFLLTALFVFLILVMSKRIPSNAPRRIFLLLVALFATTWVQDPSYTNADVKLYLLTLMSAYILFQSENIYLAAVLALTLALLSLAKGTLLHIAPPIVAIAALNHLLRKKTLPAILVPCFYAAGLVAFWLMIGQELTNLPAFLGNSLGLTHGYASGYNDSMFVFENQYMRIPGLCAVFCAYYIIIAKNLLATAGDSLIGHLSRLSYAFVEMLILFMVWKHGYLRADGHTFTFFYFVIIAGMFFFYLQPPFTSAARARRVWPLIGLLVVCVAGVEICNLDVRYSYRSKTGCPHGWNYCPEIFRNAQTLVHASDYFPQLREKYRYSVAQVQLPNTRKLVKDQPIGYFGYLMGPMLYNHFDFRPMPNTMSFTGWSHESMENDAGFFRSDASGPFYLLYAQETIDDRISAQDDALAQLEIIKHYDPVTDNAILAESKDNILLKRRQASSLIIREPLGEERMLALGAWIKVPVHGDDPIRLKARMPGNLFSDALKALYKPSDYWIDFQLSNGQVQRRKFMARMAEDGFLVAPFLDNTEQFVGALLRSEYEKYLSDASPFMNRIVKFRIFCNHLKLTCADRVAVSFEAVHGLELGRVDSSLATR